MIFEKKVSISSYLGSLRRRSYNGWKAENHSLSSVIRSPFKTSQIKRYEQVLKAQSIDYWLDCVLPGGILLT